MLAVIQAVLARSGRSAYGNTDSLKARAVAEDTDVIMEESVDAKLSGFGGPPVALVTKDDNTTETPLSKRMCEALGLLGDRPMDKLLAELAGIASQVASVDAVLTRTAQAAPPVGSEAEQWHNLASQTARWTRQALVERQQRCLAQLREAMVAAPLTNCKATADQRTLLEVATQPAQNQAPRASPGVCRHEVFHRPDARGSKKNVAADGDGSMKKGLESLRDYDADRVLIVRKIKKLGFESPELLRKYFSQFGGVKDVHVANSMMKPSAKRPTGRLRPAALGFVVMASADAAQAALAHGSSHTVCSVQIEVSDFSPFKDTGDASE